ncbi:hypothetical protein DLAC_11482 [Tieghemostelium lacteum]|uniref:Eukaryotic translation initiation factor 2A n=1 Tax=Tieghemostelium lacteum TaxID=361077 RepID=A0A152A5P8_TIELA|nr:hypothetical protein DLAC_11482 [Tieghemostelium lacteum]|eukprot:KYR01548.1 hypothetical protein DLAC_11482 [Tieghemostelium lacteum]
MSQPNSTTTTTTSSTSTSNNNNVGTTVVGSPPLQIAVRSKTIAYQETGPKYSKNETLPVHTTVENPCKHVEYSKDGSLIAYVNTNNIVIYKASNGAIHSTINRPQVSMISFSPMNSYLLTYERLQVDLNNNENNLIVWDIANQSILYKTTQKFFDTDASWPLIKWTDDEILAGRLMKNEIHFFNGRSIGVLAKKIRLQEITAFYFAPGDPYKICTFVPEQKQAPASCRIYQYPNTQEHIAHLSFFKANEAKVLWNKKGDGVLIHTMTLTDKSGKSYYGETDLWYLGTDSSSFNVSVKEFIHDVQWSPTLDQFVVIHGSMPSQSTLYNNKGNPLVDFGICPRNTIRFSPNGKVLLLGGFGNLQGEMDFWDLTRYKKISSTTAYCASYHEWAADSTHFLCAVLSPRIRVDNGFKVIKYDGTLVYQENVPELYQVVWRPQSPFLYPDEKIVFTTTVQSSTKYIPPSQRNSQAATSPTTSPSTGSGSTGPVPNGFKIYLVAPSTGSKKPAQSKPATTTTTTTSTSNSNSTGSSPKLQSQNSNSSGTGTPPQEKKELTPLDKKIRTLERKLKEIEVLKQKMSQNELLPPSAIEKVNNEDKFRDELNQLVNERNQTQ